ncbi:MAG: tRNA lysidine(34) synthetase TilS [Coriobacteriia bacterium]|nr:tRNA lysidine(34) synthetase TilS [Coriobacteriia bacterium]
MSAIKRWQLIPDYPTALILMVSGGSDSVAMARLMTELYPDYDLTMLHINHGLRGAEADADETFVCRLAAELGLPCEVRHYDIPAIQAEHGGNIEQIGRELRYQAAEDLLSSLAGMPGAVAGTLNTASRLAATPEASTSGTGSSGRILTAHTADDQAETFMMRVIKGGGTASLAGIPRQRGNIIRPLLDCTRAELREWMQANNHPWREDDTNNDTDYLRAFVRHELLPKMQTHNPRLTETISRSTQILAAESEFLEQSLEQWQAMQAQQSANLPNHQWSPQGSLPHSYRALPSSPALASRLIRQAYQAAGGNATQLTFDHVEKIYLEWQNTGFARSLPGGILVRNSYGALVFIPADSQQGGSGGTPLGMLALKELEADLFRDDPVGYAKSNASLNHLIVDTDILEQYGAPIEISFLQAGERFYPLGMNGSSKLVSDLLIDRKIAREQRKRLLKLTAGGEIVWIVGIQADDRFKARPESLRLSSIMFHSSNG